MELYELLEKVSSQESFFDFLVALEKDKRDEDEKEKQSPSSPYHRGHNGWENNSIANFLESMIAGGRDSDFPEVPSWKTFAVILYLGKIYE